MNLVGKIFVVLIFVMSILFMGFVMAVYATHRNWRDVVMNPEDQVTPEKPLGLTFQLDAVTRANEELRATLEKLDAELEAEKADRRQALAKLQTEKDTLERERDQREQQLAQLQEEKRRAVAAMEAAHQTLADLRAEVTALRTEVRQAQKERDADREKVIKLTDDLHQAAIAQRTLKARNTELTANYADALEVLRKFDLKPHPALYTGVPPKVEGEVSAVRSGGLIEINIGSDDGLMQGHTLEVFRASDGTYLGRVEVTHTLPDKAAAKILPELQKGSIQEGDSVTSKFK